MEPSVHFIILDRHYRNDTRLNAETTSAVIDCSKDEANDELYIHPSTSNNFRQLIGAILTLHDLATNLNGTRLEKPCSSLKLKMNGNFVGITIMEEPELMFILGINLAEKSSLCSSKLLLESVVHLLKFSTDNIHSGLSDAQFRSDLDGLLIASILSVLPTAILGDPTLAVCESDCIHTDELDFLLTTLEAGDLFDQKRLEDSSENIYVVGSCLFVDESVAVQHFSSPLFKSVHLFMTFHRKGFRRIKPGVRSTTVFQYYNPYQTEHSFNENFLVWINEGPAVLAVCVELPFLRDEDKRVALLNIVINGLVAVIGQGVRLIDSCVIQMYSVRRTKTTHLYGTISAGHWLQVKYYSAQTSSPRLSSQRTGAVSAEFPEYGVHESGLPQTSIASEHTDVFQESQICRPVYRIKLAPASASIYWEIYTSNGNRTIIVPPSLMKNFLALVSEMHRRFTGNEHNCGEVSVMLKYPAPALLRKFWISGLRLVSTCQELYICYPDGADATARMDVMAP